MAVITKGSSDRGVIIILTFMRLASFIASSVCGILVLGPGSGLLPRAGWRFTALRVVHRRGHRIELGIRLGPGGLESGDDLLSDRRLFRCEPCSRNLRIPLALRYRRGRRAVFEISAGLIFDRTRLELSLAQRKNGLNQMFRSITDYDGMPMEERSGGTVVSNARASIDHLSVSTLSLNAYYYFPDAVRGISPYLGAGLGPAFVEVSGVHFSTDYKDTSDNAQAYDPPCRSTTAARTRTCPTRFWPGTCTPEPTTA